MKERKKKTLTGPWICSRKPKGESQEKPIQASGWMTDSLTKHLWQNYHPQQVDLSHLGTLTDKF